MTSNNLAAAADWRTAGLRYFAYNYFLRARFGRRVQKVSIDAGFTCPNVDGTVAKGGCTFCDNRSFSPSRRLPFQGTAAFQRVAGRQGILRQIDEGIRGIQRRYKCDRFTAYFQPATNTYAPVEKLEPLYREALSHPLVVGLAIGTRSDCVPNDVLDLLQQLAAETHLSVEYGMQTMHNRSLDWMNRGHHHDSFLDAVARSQGRGFEIGAHLILGLPGESHDDMLASARELARLQIDAVKIHNLYAVRNTPLAEQVESGEVSLIEQKDYVRVVVEVLELLPPTTVVERISGEAPPDYFVGPEWCLDKSGVRRAIDAEFERRDTWQGKRYSAGR